MYRPMTIAGAIGLTAVILLSGWSGADEVYRSREVLSAPWGSSTGQFGLLEQAEGVGPQSLCVDEGGDIFILDLVNRRVQIFSPQGEHIRQTACGILAHDLRLGSNGEIYLLAPYHGLVEKYDAGGELVASWPISPDIWLIDGLRIWDGRIILRTALQTEYTVAAMDQALEPKQQLQAAKTGLGGLESDRRYGTRWVNDHLGLLQLLDGDGNQISEIQVITAEKLGSLIYLGEDQVGNVYLRAELLGVPLADRLEILKCSSGGSLQTRFRLPASDFTFIYRSLYLARNGDIYQLLTDPDGVRVLRWTTAGGTGEGR